MHVGILQIKKTNKKTFSINTLVRWTFIHKTLLFWAFFLLPARIYSMILTFQMSKFSQQFVHMHVTFLWLIILQVGVIKIRYIYFHVCVCMCCEWDKENNCVIDCMKCDCWNAFDIVSNCARNNCVYIAFNGWRMQSSLLTKWWYIYKSHVSLQLAIRNS